MDKNVGGHDRNARIVLGTALVLLGVMGYTGNIRVAFGPFPQAILSVMIAATGGVILATGLTCRCLINRLLGRDSSEE